MNKSHVQVCLPEGVGQNGMIHYVSAKCDQITCLTIRIGQNGMIHKVPAKCNQITFTSMLCLRVVVCLV